jgi:phosphoenolpyruvate phosphomutase
MAMFSAKGARLLTDCYAQLAESRREGAFHEAPSLRAATFPDLLQELIARGVPVQAIDVYKGWLEIDTFEDYRRAWSLIKE